MNKLIDTKPDPPKKQDVVHVLFALSLIVLIASAYSATRASEVIRMWALCFFALMFTIELCIVLYERHLLKKQERDITNKRL